MFTTHTTLLTTPAYVTACAAATAAADRDLEARIAWQAARKARTAAAVAYRSAYGPDGTHCPTPAMAAALARTKAEEHAAGVASYEAAAALWAAVVAKDKSLPDFDTRLQTRDEKLVAKAAAAGWATEYRTSFYMSPYWVLTPKRGSDGVVLLGALAKRESYDTMLERSSTHYACPA